MRLRKECEHGRWESHPLPGATPTMLLGSMGMAFTDENLCPGGEFLPEGALVDWCEVCNDPWDSGHWTAQEWERRGHPTTGACRKGQRLLVPLAALASQVGELE